MEDRITIIEGPPPTFQKIEDGWALGLSEGPLLYQLAVTQLRTFNGPALVERCHRAWSKRESIHLYYRNPKGLEESAPILAARSLETQDGHVLLLWVRQEPDFFEDEDNFDDDDDEGSME